MSKVLNIQFFIYLLLVVHSSSMNAQVEKAKNTNDSLTKKQDNKVYTYYNRNYLYHDTLIGEMAMRNLLISTKDKEIMNAIRISKRAQGLQLIGFLALPMAVATLSCYRNIRTEDSNSSPGHSIYYDNKQYQNLTLVFLTATVICPITAIVFKHRRLKYNRKAIDMYNQMH